VSNSNLTPAWSESGARHTWYRFLGCCFLVVVGFRLFLIHRFGASIGWGDDIDGIAHRLLGPWQRGALEWPALFVPHNGDHVMVATRLWEILWYVLNGEWDPKLVMMAKTPIFAAAMVILTHLLTRGLERRRYTCAAVLTVLFAFPFNYHNLLWAFQSQFDFFLLTAALGWMALLDGRPVLALTIAALSPLTLGAGPVLAASYVPYLLATILGRHRAEIPPWPWRRAGLYTAGALVIAAAGASLPTAEAMPREGALADKIATLFQLGAWPFSNLLSAVARLPESSNLIPGQLLNFPTAESSWMMALAGAFHRHPLLLVLAHVTIAVFVMAPLIGLTFLVVRRRVRLRVVLGPLALSGFVALMIGATAVARTNQPTIAIRFVDYIMLAGFISIVAGFVLGSRRPRWRRWLALWAVIMGLGYLATAGATMSQMVNRRKPQAGLEILQQYYAGNRAILTQRENLVLFIVSEDPTAFMAQLDDPEVRAVMPRVVFDPDATPGPAARIANAVAYWGLPMAGFAAAGAIWIGMRRPRLKFLAVPVASVAGGR
jgi:hypothetical protein